MKAMPFQIRHKRVITCAKEVVRLWRIYPSVRSLDESGWFIVEMTRLCNAVDRLNEMKK